MNIYTFIHKYTQISHYRSPVWTVSGKWYEFVHKFQKLLLSLTHKENTYSYSHIENMANRSHLKALNRTHIHTNTHTHRVREVSVSEE